MREQVNLVNVYENLELPESKITIWSASKPFLTTSTWFDNEDDLIDYIDESIKKRSEYIANLKNGILDDDFINYFLPGVAKYDYLGDFLGEENVYMKSLLSYTKDGLTPTYVSVESKAKDGNYLKILKKSGEHYLWQDYISLNGLKELYSEFVNVSKEKTLYLKK